MSFIYHGDYNGLSANWEQLMGKYYDVMHSESYDWWTLAIAFETNKRTIERIKKYEFSGTDDLGVNVVSRGNRIIISIFCCLSPDVSFPDDRYNDYYEEEDEDDEYEDNDDELEEAVESEDYLLNLLSENRKYLKKGDCRLLYGIWQKYGVDSDNDPPPEPLRMNKLPEPTKSLLSILDKH